MLQWSWRMNPNYPVKVDYVSGHAKKSFITNSYFHPVFICESPFAGVRRFSCFCMISIAIIDCTRYIVRAQQLRKIRVFDGISQFTGDQR